MNRDDILKGVLTVVQDLANDWEIGYEGTLGAETRLIGDLNLESIDIMQLIGALEDHFGKEGMPFEKLLLKDGRYVDDVTLGEIVAFLDRELGE